MYQLFSMAVIMAQVFSHQSHRHVSREFGRRVRSIALLTALTGGLWCAVSPAFQMAAPTLKERQDRSTSSKASAQVAERPRDSRAKSSGNETTFNATLQLDFGRAEPTGDDVTHGSTWATCFADYRDDGPKNVDGPSESRHVLEQWIMRGEREVVDSFNAWRQHTSEPVSVRCSQMPIRATQDITCLECVNPQSSAGHLPFTPSSPILSPSYKGVSSTAVLMASPMTVFGDLQLCLATAANGFCKSGSVVVPLA